MMQQFNEEKNELMDQIRSLEDENQKYLDKIIKNSKDSADMYEKRRDPNAPVEAQNTQPANGLGNTRDKMVIIIWVTKD